MSLPTAWSGRCSPGGATIVRQLPVARAWASATWARPRSSSRASSSVPTTWNAKSLSIRTRTPSPSGVEQLAQPNRRSSTGSAARANRSRWKARSTTVATHQPVIGSLRSSNRPAATPRQAPAQRGADARRRTPWRRCAPARSTDAVVGAAPASPELARDRGRGDAGHAARVDQVEVGEVDGHVEGDAVVADAALDAQAERADLARVRHRPGRTSSRGGRRAGRPRRRAPRRSRRGPPRAPGRTAGAAGRGRPGATIG